MTNDKNQFELIEQYLQGELTPDQREIFEKKLVMDEDFTREVVLQQQLVKELQWAGRAALRQQLKVFHEELQQETNELNSDPNTYISIHQDREKSSKSKPTIWLVAACIIFILISSLAYFWINQSTADTQELLANYYKPYPNIAYISSRASSGQQTKHQEAFKAYDQGDYTKSIQLFKQLLHQKNDETVLFYLGNAYLANKQPSEAIEIFKQYMNTYEEFTQESTWYLSLAYLQEGKNHQAIALLESLAQSNNSYSDEASEVLKTLNASN